MSTGLVAAVDADIIDGAIGRDVTAERQVRLVGITITHRAIGTDAIRAIAVVGIAPTAGEAAHPDRPLQDPLVVDDNQDRKFLKAIQVAFQGLRSELHPNVPMVRSPRFRGSAPDEVLHLADMVCGATGAYLTGDARWYKLIKSRCVGLTTLP